MESRLTPLIVIVGQTASGKSNLAISLAEKYNGEIICADSRTVYAGMDIGTAKPNKKERAKIKHYLLDIYNPDQQINASDIKNAVNQAIGTISNEAKIPILVGGTGLYIDAVIYNFKFGPKKNEILRTELGKLSLGELAEKAQDLNISPDEVNFSNKRHLVRAIERGGVIKANKKLRGNTLLLGLCVPEQKLKARIKTRIERMIEDGLEKEVRELVQMYGFDAPGLNAIGYREWEGNFNGEQSIERVKQKLYKNTWQYARRQKTWFKRDVNIKWITSVEDAPRAVEQFLIQ